MLKRFLIAGSAVCAVVLMGAGCFASTTADVTTPDGDVLSSTTGVDVCIKTDADATGAVRLFAANMTDARKNFDEWFTDKVLATGNAGDEMCGHTSFAVQTGDALAINGDWSDAKRWLVENRTPDASGSDNVHEIWIDDEYYSVGKECAYQSNGKKGFDIVCTIR